MGAERRTEARQEQEEHILVNIASIGQEPMDFECSAKDLSPKGIRLHGETLLKLNSEVDLVIRWGAKQKDYRLTGVVKWITETTTSGYW